MVITINITQFLKWIAPGAILVAGWFLKQGYDLMTKWHHPLPILSLIWFSVGGFLLFISGWIFVLSQSILIKDLQNKSKEQQSNESIANRLGDLEKNVTEIKEKAQFQQTDKRI